MDQIGRKKPTNKTSLRKKFWLEKRRYLGPSSSFRKGEGEGSGGREIEGGSTSHQTDGCLAAEQELKKPVLQAGPRRGVAPAATRGRTLWPSAPDLSPSPCPNPSPSPHLYIYPLPIHLINPLTLYTHSPTDSHTHPTMHTFLPDIYNTYTHIYT